MAETPNKPESTLVDEGADDRKPKKPGGALDGVMKSTVPTRPMKDGEVPWPSDNAGAATKTFEPLGGPEEGTLPGTDALPPMNDSPEPPTHQAVPVFAPLEEPDTASGADAAPPPMPHVRATQLEPAADPRTLKAPPVPGREGERVTGLRTSYNPDSIDSTPRPSRPPLAGAQGPRPSIPGQTRQTRSGHPVPRAAEHPPADGAQGPRPSIPGQPRQTRSTVPAQPDGAQGPRPSMPGQPRQTRSGVPVQRAPDSNAGPVPLARPSGSPVPRPSREHRVPPRASAPPKALPPPPPPPSDSLEVTPSDVGKSTEMRRYGEVGRGKAEPPPPPPPALSADATGEILDPRDERPDASQTFSGFTEEQFRRALIALAAASALLVVLIVVWVFNVADGQQETNPSEVSAIPHAKGAKRDLTPKVEAPKAVLVEQLVDAGNGETRTVLAAAGTVRIVTDPDTNVFIDGKDFGPQPVLVTLPAGKVSVLLRNDKLGFKRTVSVDISPNERTAVRFVFTMGWIEIDAPQGGRVLVDGKATTGTHVQVWEGTHKVEVVHSDKKHTRAVQAVEVTGSMTTSVHFEAPSIADDN